MSRLLILSSYAHEAGSILIARKGGGLVSIALIGPDGEEMTVLFSPPDAVEIITALAEVIAK